jgi:hypothetical protein
LKTEQIYGNKLISKERGTRYLNLLKFGTIERRHSALDYKTIEEFWKQKKIILKMLLN